MGFLILINVLHCRFMNQASLFSNNTICGQMSTLAATPSTPHPGQTFIVLPVCSWEMQTVGREEIISFSAGGGPVFSNCSNNWRSKMWRFTIKKGWVEHFSNIKNQNWPLWRQRPDFPGSTHNLHTAACWIWHTNRRSRYFTSDPSQSKRWMKN